MKKKIVKRVKFEMKTVEFNPFGNEDTNVKLKKKSSVRKPKVVKKMKKRIKRSKKKQMMYYRSSFSSSGSYSFEMSQSPFPLLLSKIVHKFALEIDFEDPTYLRNDRDVRLFSLPFEVQQEIVQYLDYEQIVTSVSLVSKRFFQLVNSDGVLDFLGERYNVRKINTIKFPEKYMKLQEYKPLTKLRYMKIRNELHFFQLDEEDWVKSILFVPKRLKKEFTLLSRVYSTFGSKLVYIGRDMKTLELDPKLLFRHVDVTQLRQFCVKHKTKKTGNDKTKLDGHKFVSVSKLGKNQFLIGFRLKPRNNIVQIRKKRASIEYIEGAFRSYHQCKLLFDFSEMSVSLIAKGKVTV